MKKQTKTKVKAGGFVLPNHSARIVKTGVKAGGVQLLNHSARIVR